MTDGPETDATFDDHRQGDVISLPIDVLGLVEGERADSGERNVALISQTCDIVRSDRDYVIVAALTDLPATQIGLAQRGSMPRYANLPAMPAATFADLDHITTLPKSLLRGRTRIPGVDPTAWDQVRNLSRSIGRKFSRFAFPDAVVPWFDPLRPVIEKRHDRLCSRAGTPRDS